MGWSFFNSEGAERVVADTTIPSATIWMTASAVAAAGWLMCDGSEVAIASYPELFNAIGTTYNSNGSAPAPAVGNFRIPDFRAHHPVGAGTAQTGTPAAGNSYLRGVKAGTKDHTHPVNVDAHTHTMAHTHDLSNHSHTYSHTHDFFHTHPLQTHVHENEHRHLVPSTTGINSGTLVVMRPDVAAGLLDGANGNNGYPNSESHLGGDIGVASVQNDFVTLLGGSNTGTEVWFFASSPPKARQGLGLGAKLNTGNNTTTPNTSSISTSTTNSQNNATSGSPSINATGAATVSTTSGANVATGTATVIANIPPVLPINFMIKV